MLRLLDATEWAICLTARIDMFWHVDQRPPIPGHRATLRPAPRWRLLDGGEEAFGAILRRVDAAQRSIQVRAFVWRDDATGNALAAALLRAAERGVEVAIRKDRIGANYEMIAGDRQSFFSKRVTLPQHVRNVFMSIVYAGFGPHRQRPNKLLEALLAHPRIRIEHGTLNDHSKLFVFDDRWVVLGSMGIGDNHRHEWIDVMVEVEDEELVDRLRQRSSAVVDFDPTRRMDFMLHSRSAHAPGTCPMLDDRLALIERAQTRLTVVMAYLGDRRFTDALVRAVERGVAVTVIAPERADVLGDTNLATCEALLHRCRGASNLRLVLHPAMVHAKLVVVDGRWSDIGSANFTRLSHGVYDEVNLYVDDPAFAFQLEQLTERLAAEGLAAGPGLRYRKHYLHVERFFVAVMSRNAP